MTTFKKNKKKRYHKFQFLTRRFGVALLDLIDLNQTIHYYQKLSL